MEKFNNMFEQVVLLGIIPILGGSRNLTTAVITTVILVLTAIILRLVSRLLNQDSLAGAHWVLFLAVGISLSYVAYLFSAFLYPQVYQHSGIYLLLIGVSPLTYYGCKLNVSFSDLWKRFNIFFLTIIVVSFFRELIGFGSILGRSFFEVGFAPLSSFQGAPGAFIILGTIWLIFRWIISANLLDEGMLKIEEGTEIE